MDDIHNNQQMTLNRHILSQQMKHPEARGDLTTILSSLGLAAKVVASAVRRAGLVNILGFTGAKNVQDEKVQKLDELANDPSLKQPNWDTYGAEPLSDSALSISRQILAKLPPAVLAHAQSVPTVTGGVQIEWHAGGGDFEIEVGDDADVESIVNQISTGVSSLDLQLQ